MALFVLSAVDSDRPGLTQALADAIHSAGGNWLESRLSRLGGLYVGSVLVELEATSVDALRAAAAAVDAQGLEVRIAPAIAQPAEGPTGEAGEDFDFALVGQDRPGIVRQVTAALRALDANIETFKTWIEPEPHAGAPLFHMQARLRLPPGVEAARIQAALEAISAEIMIDVSLTPAG